MFKLETLKLQETAEFDVLHPTTGEVLEDEDGKVVLTMYGSASSKYRAAIDKMLRKKNARGKREPTLAEARTDSVEFLAELSISISNLEYDGIVGVEGKARFTQLYSDDSFSWLRDFASNAQGTTEGFLKQ